MTQNITTTTWKSPNASDPGYYLKEIIIIILCMFVAICAICAAYLFVKSRRAYNNAQGQEHAESKSASRGVIMEEAAPPLPIDDDLIPSKPIQRDPTPDSDLEYINPKNEEPTATNAEMIEKVVAIYDKDQIDSENIMHGVQEFMDKYPDFVRNLYITIKGCYKAWTYNEEGWITCADALPATATEYKDQYDAIPMMKRITKSTANTIGFIANKTDLQLLQKVVLVREWNDAGEIAKRKVFISTFLKRKISEEICTQIIKYISNSAYKAEKEIVVKLFATIIKWDEQSHDKEL